MALSDKARAFLEEPRFASLATINPDGSVQQTVMWYLIRDDHIVMNTARGRKKDRNLLRDPRVSICIEDGLRFVSMRGTVTLIEEQPQAQADILEMAIRYDGKARGEEQARDAFSKQERISLHLPIANVIEHGFDD